MRSIGTTHPCVGRDDWLCVLVTAACTVMRRDLNTRLTPFFFFLGRSSTSPILSVFKLQAVLMADLSTDAGDTKHDVEPSDNASAQPAEVAVKDAASVPAETVPKVACKKHSDPKSDSQKKKKQGKNRQLAPDSSSDESSSTESSSTESETDQADTESVASETSSEERRKRQRVRTKARPKRFLKDKKRKKKRKPRSRKAAESDSDSDSTSDSDSDSDSDSKAKESLDEQSLWKLLTRLTLKRKARQLRDQTNDDLGIMDPLGLETRREKRVKKKKPASKVAFKRVDQRK